MRTGISKKRTRTSKPPDEKGPARSMKRTGPFSFRTCTTQKDCTQRACEEQRPIATSAFAMPHSQTGTHFQVHLATPVHAAKPTPPYPNLREPLPMCSADGAIKKYRPMAHSQLGARRHRRLSTEVSARVSGVVNQMNSSAPSAKLEGNSGLSRRLKTPAVACALPAPLVIIHVRVERAMKGAESETRSGGIFGEWATPTTKRSVTSIS